MPKLVICKMTRDQALLCFKRRMDVAGIEFWLGHGTCLGAYRDGALIKSDHDIDIQLFGSDIKKVEKAVNLPYEIRGTKPDQFTFVADGWIKFDVCFWQKVGDEYHLRIRGGKPDRLSGKFRELKPIQFLGETFLVPKHTEEYLEYYYDKDWRTRIDGRHANIMR